MSAVIRCQVVRLLRDAIDELQVHPDAMTPRELVGLSSLALMYDREDLGVRLARLAFDRGVVASESGR